MIKIKKVLVGNSEEAYVESRFTDGINIIFSNDNNRGKTIVIQSLMYAMGSDPVFPATFNYKNYYCIVELEINGSILKILRKKNTFVVSFREGIYPFDSESELKKYWSENVTELPEILKKGKQHTVPLSLFNQVFFTVQDGRSSSRTVGSFYKKDDFIEMVFSLKGVGRAALSAEEKNTLKLKKKELDNQRKALMKRAVMLETESSSLAIMSPTADKIETESTIKELDHLKDQITELRTHRNRALTRLKKNQSVLTELNSLNRTINTGKLVCLTCGSDHIGYMMEGSETTFDVTTAETRDQIVDSIKERIESYSEDIEKVDYAIHELQALFNELLETKHISLFDVMIHEEEYRNIREVDHEIMEAETRIDAIEDQLNSSSVDEDGAREGRKKLMEDILETMSEAHRAISGNATEDYSLLFTTEAQRFSGSESTEYFISRSVALEKTLHHGYPIVIDSFRAEDLSTSRESASLNLFRQLSNQIILTTTIKDEEHDKYASQEDVTAIDYSQHAENKLLSESYVVELANEMKSFGLVLMGK